MQDIAIEKLPLILMKTHFLVAIKPVRRSIFLGFAMTACFFVSACGQKGPLYKPDDDNQASQQQSSSSSLNVVETDKRGAR